MTELTSIDGSPLGDDSTACNLDDLRQASGDAIRSLKQDYAWTDADRRIQGIHRLRNVIQSTLALYAFHRNIFPTGAFWKTFFEAVPSEAEFTDHYRECDVLLRFAALHGLFSAFESDVRGVVSALDVTACAGGTAQFDGVMRWLLSRATSAQPHTEFVELLRLTRNTIHNNGVHRPTNGKSASVAYRGKVYAFTVNEPIDFVDWSFVVLVGQGLLDLFIAIGRDPLVAELSTV